MAIAFYTCASAQNTQAPAEAENAFKEKFPSATNVSWVAKDKNYEATFTDGGKKQKAEFNAKGKWVEGETMVDPNQLPKVIVDAVSEKYVGYTIKEAEQVDKKVGPTVYELDIESNRKVCQVKYNAQGDQVGATQCSLAEH